jgi:hypothetical protein
MEGKSVIKRSDRQKAQTGAASATIRRAVTEARRREKWATKIRTAKHDLKRDLIVVELSTGAVLGVPKRLIPGFAKASARALSDLAISPEAESLWSDTADDGVLLEQLLVLAAGERTIGTLGAQINASKRTAARAAASRANGAKGGRPRKRAA